MILLPDRFDDIRPYYDSEIPSAMERIASDPLLASTLEYLGRGDELEAFKDCLRKITDTDQLQKQIMYPIVRQVIGMTIDEYTYDGVENVDCSQGHLFVSNHRDIAMDALLQQLALVDNGIPTSHVTFGSNLMQPQFIVDLGLCNKMFKTVRKSNDFESFMESSIHLSDYINYVTGQGESVWIAQRNGRTKDGFDKTEPGLIRMLLLGRKDRKAVESLGIIPVSVSYQWEPCDILKAVELLKSKDGKEYVKAPGEDVNSIVTGLISPKGKVHVSIGKPIDCSCLNEKIGRSDIAAITRMIDDEIYSGYRLWDTNYAAYDILHGTTSFTDKYSEDLKESLIRHIEDGIKSYPDLDPAALRTLLLQIYSGPVTCTKNIDYGQRI